VTGNSAAGAVHSDSERSVDRMDLAALARTETASARRAVHKGLLDHLVDHMGWTVAGMANTVMETVMKAARSSLEHPADHMDQTETASVRRAVHNSLVAHRPVDRTDCHRRSGALGRGTTDIGAARSSESPPARTDDRLHFEAVVVHRETRWVRPAARTDYRRFGPVDSSIQQTVIAPEEAVHSKTRGRCSG